MRKTVLVVLNLADVDYRNSGKTNHDIAVGLS